jgi:platelet-activating factor acetylhydrolase
VLKEIHEGRGLDIARQNRREEGYIGGSSRGLKGVDWARWKNRFHIDKITVAGHSFGAATVVEVLRNADRFENVQAGIIYDIWGAPIKPPEEDHRHRIHSPLLGINSEAFMYWQTNFDAVMALMNEASEQGAPAFLCTVRGSVHISQSDFSVLYKHLCSFFLKATVHPQRAIDLNISASLEFLRDVGAESSGKSIIERCLTDEGLLQLEPLDEVPNDQKPDDKFIAAKLKVPHEFKTRLAASVQRKVKRKKGKGKVHGWYEPGDEMWMHFKPEEGQLRKWQEGKKPVEEYVEEEGGQEPGSGGGSEGRNQKKAESQCETASRETSANTSQATLQNTTQDASQNTLADDWVGDEGTATENSKQHTLVNRSQITSKDASQDGWLGRPPGLSESTDIEHPQ